MAFRHVLENSLTLVWGPPGTGKTHFLAKALLCMAAAHKHAGLTFHAAVTAFTHAAIENLLKEIKDHLPLFGLDHDLALYKLKHASSPRGQELETLSESDLYDLSGSEDLVIAGGTVYSFEKAKVQGLFPILIVDEASQMKFGELALGMQALEAGGQLVLAGDDLQLPPIISGEYPEPEDGLPGLHESVFAYLKARDRETAPFTFQIHENWRMNKTLCDFSAQSLYGSGYQPANDEVAARKIHLKPIKKNTSQETALCKWMIDPDYPLVVGVLEDVQAAVENRTEAELTAMLAVYLRHHLIFEETGQFFSDDPNGDSLFWRKGLFIVSPHHAQIKAIRKALARMRQWHSTPFVDTVDKMQGQQCRNVIVSYGVSDSETALSEAEFIYSLNRLNVSVTRAQAKCIVFLPRPLLEPSFDLLQNEKALAGLEHMHALIRFCRDHGEEKEFDLALTRDSGRLTAFRV